MDMAIQNAYQRRKEDFETIKTQIKTVTKLRGEGLSWKAVASLMNLSLNRVMQLDWMIRNFWVQNRERMENTNITPDSSVNDLPLSVRVANCLNNANLATVGQVLNYPSPEFLRLRNFGRQSLAELESVLSEHGLSLKQNQNNHG